MPQGMEASDCAVKYIQQKTFGQKKTPEKTGVFL